MSVNNEFMADYPSDFEFMCETCFNNKGASKMAEASVEKVPVVIDWEVVEAALNSNTLKVKQMSEQLGIKQADLANAIKEKYGNTVVFKRGRKGGVYRSNPQ